MKHKQIIEALRESEEKYRALFEESRDVIFITTPEGKFIDINPAGVELFGYSSKDELLKVSIDKDLYLKPGDREIYQRTLHRQGFVKDYELVLKKKDGQPIIVFITANIVVNDKGEIVAYRGIMRDMTGYRKLEQQLIQAQKMESIGRLAGGVAHDFNNLLTAIQGYTDLALKEIPEGSSAHDELKEIREASDRAADLTRQLLLFSRREPLKLEHIDINKIVSNLLKMLNRLIGERFSIVTVLQKDPCTIYADVGHIEQVIMNLVVNAKDSMPQGGEIFIKTDCVRIDKKYLETHPYANIGDFACLSVKDTGIGMNSDTVSHVFEPFFSTKEAGKGTGLGLSVVYGIVTRHGGWVDVESLPGRGSTFKVYLPAVAKKADEKYHEADSIDKFKGRGERILLVEDEKSIRKLVEKVLRGNGYTVFAAEDAEEAGYTFDKENGNFHLVFSDAVLPGEGGVELVGRLLAKKPELHVLISSGYGSDVDMKAIRKKGYSFLPKPYDMPDLMQTIRELLDKE